MTDWLTRYTVDFIGAALPEGTRRVLEVGCGKGEVAASLAAAGLSVVALDSDEAAVAQARSRGVDARRAEWPDFSDGAFDAVLFTRSLHHLGDLERSVAAAFACLTPGGRAIVEDFAFEETDEATLRWFRERAAALGDDGAASSHFLGDLLAAPEPLTDWWRHRHDHRLHPARGIEAALRAQDPGLRAEGAAYYFRYLADGQPEQLKSLLDEEKALIETRAISPLGRRYVAVKA
jgi:SAM-dependent methyltransferase